MTTIRALIFTFSFLLFATAPLHGILVAYWNFDAAHVGEKLLPNSGTQADQVTMTIDSGLFGFAESVSGTAINQVGTVTTNRALAFVDLIDSGFTPPERITITGLDFSGLSQVSLSFANRSTAIFSWETDLDIDYSLDGGTTWNEIVETNVAQTDWDLESFAFGSLLDNASNAALRIEIKSWFSVVETISFDNLQVNAIPEVKLLPLWLGAGALILVGYRRWSVRSRGTLR